MSKAKLSFFSAIGGLIFLILFKIFKAINSEGATAFVEMFYERILFIIIGFVLAGIIGSMVQKIMTRNMSPENRVHAEKRFNYAAWAYGSVGCGVLFILGIEKDNIGFFIGPLIIIAREAGAILYARWDAFVDRRA